MCRGGRDTELDRAVCLLLRSPNNPKQTSPLKHLIVYPAVTKRKYLFFGHCNKYGAGSGEHLLDRPRPLFSGKPWLGLLLGGIERAIRMEPCPGRKVSVLPPCRPASRGIA